MAESFERNRSRQSLLDGKAEPKPRRTRPIRASRTRRISTHAPRAGSDARPTSSSSRTTYFNPRSPCGERPCRYGSSTPRASFQPTLPVRGATLEGVDEKPPLPGISTHAPRAGSDSCGKRKTTWSRYFNPRSPCGERRRELGVLRRPLHFNPRSPCGERRLHADSDGARNIFQPTLPVRGATGSVRHVCGRWPISTHAPRAGSDAIRCASNKV